MAPIEETVCRELVELVTAYLERALSPAEHSRLEAHLVICAGCREYVDQMRSTVDALREVAPGEVPAERRRELLDVFRGWAGR